MNMYHFLTSLNRSSLLAFTAALALGAAACAGAPTPPPVAAAPPSQAFQQAAGGVTSQQAPEDGVQFVQTEHKEMTVHDDQGAPATGLKMDQSARSKRQ
jgi:hypothetical protein